MAMKHPKKNGATIFCYPVKNPKDYVAELEKSIQNFYKYYEEKTKAVDTQS